MRTNRETSYNHVILYRPQQQYLLGNLDKEDEDDDDEQVVKDADSSDDDVDDPECNMTGVKWIWLDTVIF